MNTPRRTNGNATSARLSLVVRLVPLVVGLVFELARSLAMTLGFVGVAEHVRGLGRLALAARGPLVSRRGAVMRSALADALILLLVSHRGPDYSPYTISFSRRRGRERLVRARQP
jgi:hypothetical protein